MVKSNAALAAVMPPPVLQADVAHMSETATACGGVAQIYGHTSWCMQGLQIIAQ
jgi:hypothetical protein